MASEASGEETSERPHEPSAREDGADTTVAVLLVVAAIIVAVIGARAAIVGDSGSDTWHTAVRQDVKRTAGIVEDVRFVYQEEVPQALSVEEARLRSKELRRTARRNKGSVRDILEAMAKGQLRVAEPIAKVTPIATEPRYDPEKGGVLRRLADQRAKNPALVALDPSATAQRGSDLSLQSSLLVGASIPAGVAFLLGALAEGFGRARRWLVPAGFAFAGLAVVLALVVEIAY